MIAGNNLAISVSGDLGQHQEIRWPVPFHLRLINSVFLNAYYQLLDLFAVRGTNKLLGQELHLEILGAKITARWALAGV